jgi:hypothetical protein
MGGVTVSLAEYSDGPDAHLFGRAHDAQCYLSPICYQYFFHLSESLLKPQKRETAKMFANQI